MRGAEVKIARDPVERFWEKVNKTGDCWVWTAATSGPRDYQYGTMVVGSRTDGTRHYIKAHVYAYELLVGVVPQGMIVHHKCENTRCVRPDHLEAIDQKTHILERHNGVTAQNARKTHCPKGHPFVGDNLYIEEQGGGRRCRICRREWRLNYERRRRQEMRDARC